MIQVEGLVEAQAFVTALGPKDADWSGPLEGMGLGLTRYAITISPVITGSYRASHRATVSGKSLTISIDPAGRNVVTGTPVTRYAGPVEQRHQVYGRMFTKACRMAVTVLEDLLKGKGL